MYTVVSSYSALKNFLSADEFNVWSVKGLDNTTGSWLIEYSDASPAKDADKQDESGWKDQYEQLVEANIDLQDQVNDTQNALDAANAREDGLIARVNEWRDRYYETLGELNRLKAVSDAETPVDTKPQPGVDFISQLSTYADFVKTFLPK